MNEASQPSQLDQTRPPASERRRPPAPPEPAPAQPTPAPEAAAPAPRRGARKAFLVLAAVAVVALGGIGAYVLATRGQETTDDAQVDAAVVPLAPRVGGVVGKVAVQDNQQVHAGQLLVELDPKDYAAKLKQAEADLDAARAQSTSADAGVLIAEAASKGGLSSAKAMLSGTSLGVRSAAAQVDAAKASVAKAEVDAQKAESDFARATDLFGKAAVTQTALDDARARRDSAAAALTQARAQVAALDEARRVASSRVDEARGRVEQSAPIDAQIATAQAAADLAKARVKGAEAALDLARIQLSNTQITAPADGVVSKLAVHEGQLVAPGQPIVELVPNGSYVVANFKETQLGEMRAGERARITVDAYPGRTFEGRLESLSGGTGARFSLLPPENATGNFVKVVQRVPVRIEWLNPPADVQLRAGMSAEVTVYTR